MRPKTWVVSLLLVLGFASSAWAQMGMDLFKKPSITKVFHPVVGKGAQYETTSKSGTESKVRTTEMAIVGKETVEGKDGYWMQFVSSDAKGQSVVGKALFTVDDFQFHRMIIQPPGQGAIEMPTNMSGRTRERIDEQMKDWHSVGTETITVPAGTFSCDHWKNDKDGAEVWTSDKVTPYGLVKETGKDNTMVLVKVLDNVPDRITGPVKKFDMQEMMQQMQQQRQQPKP
ncbi:MAG TPA: hypothetical protein VED66_00620 [Candidatus Sulfotelmatobacter sp.]|nr:hypothetical protein [Candidatus Sulfotelmatobacter sp.]